MKFTNSLKLPQPLVSAVTNDPYSKGVCDYSVTELLKPPRQAVLQKAHGEEITEDVADRIWSLMGQVVHGILERSNVDAIAERRMVATFHGKRVSGGMDAYYDHGLLQDYKTTTAYKFKSNTVPEDFEQQLNCYAEILRQNGDKVERLEIVGILRDWSKMEAFRDPNYPRKQVVVLPVPLWPSEKVQAFIGGRIDAHEKAKAVLPLCNDNERWARKRVWAVMKPGRKTAVKLHDSEQFAKEHAKSEPGLYVVDRPGESIRCAFYCSAAPFCSQYQKTLQPVSPTDGFTLTTVKGA